MYCVIGVISYLVIIYENIILETKVRGEDKNYTNLRICYIFNIRISQINCYIRIVYIYTY